ncbi:MAG: hypothetical protein GF308_18815 [Candidatus Heimdallarchaeota archaeon]|nr:hypothetical protein [Candidatus Heimdallarchaeota archaeon]
MTFEILAYISVGLISFGWVVSVLSEMIQKITKKISQSKTTTENEEF